MSNKSEATWHPNSGPTTDHADLIGRLHKWCDRVVSPHAHTAMVEAADALANSVPREQYDKVRADLATSDRQHHDCINKLHEARAAAIRAEAE